MYSPLEHQRCFGFIISGNTRVVNDSEKHVLFKKVLEYVEQREARLRAGALSIFTQGSFRPFHPRPHLIPQWLFICLYVFVYLYAYLEVCYRPLKVVHSSPLSSTVFIRYRWSAVVFFSHLRILQRWIILKQCWHGHIITYQHNVVCHIDILFQRRAVCGQWIVSFGSCCAFSFWLFEYFEQCTIWVTICRIQGAVQKLLGNQQLVYANKWTEL